MSAKTWVVTAVIGGVVLAGMSKHGGAGGGDSLGMAAVPLGGSYTPATWAQAFIAGTGEPETACNQAFVVAWEGAEGGAWNDSATDNPLNTSQPEPGSYPINSDNVQAFTSWAGGLRANETAIKNGLYQPVLSAMSAGDDAQACADAVANSPWGTSAFTANC